MATKKAPRKTAKKPSTKEVQRTEYDALVQIFRLMQDVCLDKDLGQALMMASSLIPLYNQVAKALEKQGADVLEQRWSAASATLDKAEEAYKVLHWKD